MPFRKSRACEIRVVFVSGIPLSLQRNLPRIGNYDADGPQPEMTRNGWSLVIDFAIGQVGGGVRAALAFSDRPSFRSGH
jgi:hypothetical protein